MSFTNKVLATSILALTGFAAQAENVSNPFAVELTQLYAVTQPGAPDPSGDSMCKDKYGEYLGSALDGKYDINTSTLMMSAEANYLGSMVKMFPLGIAHTYAFMTDGVPPALSDRQINRIIVNVSTDFEKVEGDVMFVTGGEFNCVLSNLPANNM